MKIEEIKYFCDVCKKETNYEGCFSVNYPVIFTTNQTDGVASKPYIEQKQIDICRDCADKILKITASGCQGYNEYKVRNKNTKWQKLKEWVKLQIDGLNEQLTDYDFDSYCKDILIDNFNVMLQQMQELEVEDE